MHSNILILIAVFALSAQALSITDPTRLNGSKLKTLIKACKNASLTKFMAEVLEKADGKQTLVTKTVKLVAPPGCKETETNSDSQAKKIQGLAMKRSNMLPAGIPAYNSEQEFKEGEIWVPQYRMQQRGIFVPGTKWCGPGNKAAYFEDLGEHEREDACCREHDHCPWFLLGGECEFEICNCSPYTRSHCLCDAKFYHCIQSIDSCAAKIIDFIFFDALQMKCFTQDEACMQDENCCPMKFQDLETYISKQETNPSPKDKVLG